MSVMGTNVKINIFETLLVTSGFLMKSHTIFITMHGFAFSYISRIQVHVFVTNTAFVANPVWE